MHLRSYQSSVKADIYEAWAKGNQNVGLQLPTGAGKTVLFSNLAAEHNGYCLIIAHRMELVSQISVTLGRHGIKTALITQKQPRRNIISLHMSELGRSFYDPNAKCIVAGVDTLLKLNPCENSWMSKISLLIQDEAHHVLKKNKWGKAAALFPNAKGLYPTATPIRADGCGLGRASDGVMDTLIIGPSMRELITQGYLTDYRIVAPKSNIDLSRVSISSSGDFNPGQLRSAVHKSKIVGDVVKHYLKFAKGKLGITFAVSIECALEITKAYQNAGVSAEILTGKTPDLLRADILRRFRNREILQLVNVDLLGEGVDVPAIEVVSMARPTEAYAVYSQQFGRALRPIEGKDRAIIIDHVENVARHGLPDNVNRIWSLERREKKSKSMATILLKNCLNTECLAIFERFKKSCPFCGHYEPPGERSTPAQVEGDLTELCEQELLRLRGEVSRIDNLPRFPINADSIVVSSIRKNHLQRQESQAALRDSIALWAGHEKLNQSTDAEIYRKFYLTFGLDVLTAQTLGSPQAIALKDDILKSLRS